MRRTALLVVLCFVLSLFTGILPSPLAAEYCWIESKSEAAGCCGNKRKINQYDRTCCQFTGCRSWEYTGYYCTAFC